MGLNSASRSSSVQLLHAPSAAPCGWLLRLLLAEGDCCRKENRGAGEAKDCCCRKENDGEDCCCRKENDGAAGEAGDCCCRKDNDGAAGEAELCCCRKENDRAGAGAGAGELENMVVASCSIFRVAASSRASETV